MNDPWYPWQATRTAVGHAFYALSVTVLALTATPIGLLLWPFRRTRERVFTGIVRGYTRLLTQRALPALGITEITEISGVERIPASGAHVIVANHRGFLDTPLLLGVFPRARVLVKSEYGRSLVQRVLGCFFDYITMDVSSPESIQAAREHCRKLLVRGEPLLVYPEGSRARSRRLGDFKHLAFQLAAEAGAPVLPVVVHQSPAFMAKAKGSAFPRRTVRCHLRVLEPLTPDQPPKDMAAEAHRRIARELKSLDAGFPP